MAKWKFDDKRLKKLHKESKLNLSYEDFKKFAEDYANQLLKNIKKEIENERVAQK